MSYLNPSITGMLGLHMLCKGMLHLHTCSDAMSHLNTSITGMFNLHMLCRGVFYLGICTYEMSHLNTSITGMFNLHMLCREVLDLHTCASYLDTSITGFAHAWTSWPGPAQDEEPALDGSSGSQTR